MIILGQDDKLVGFSSDEDGAIHEALDILGHLAEANAATVVVSALSLGLLVLSARIGKRVPGALVLVVLAIAASWGLDLASRGVAIPVPAGLPSFEVPDVARSDLGALAPAAVAIFVVACADAILTARWFAARHHELVVADQELLALGFAQLSSKVTQGFPVGTSGSRTAVNDDMGDDPGQRPHGISDGRPHPAVPDGPDPAPALGSLRGSDRLRSTEADRPRTVAGADPKRQG